MKRKKTLSIVEHAFLQDPRGNQLPASVPSAPPGFRMRRLFYWWVTDDWGYRLAVLHPPAHSRDEAERVADELCRRHGWLRPA